MTTTLETKIFKPRPSTGWIWVGAIGTALLAGGLGMLFGSGLSGPFWITILLTVPIGIGFLVIAGFFPTMRYAMDDKRLVLTYGPLLRYVIDIQEIKRIRRRDMGIGLVSSFRFPGLALFNVPYPEVGTVKMCATAAGTGILLIETETRTYGVTPRDEETFIAELKRRMGR